MAGLLIKELIARGDLQRCLIVCPGSLAEQWQDELHRRFRLPFEILTNDKPEAARTGNWFLETNLVIARLDKLSRDEDVQQKLQAPDCRWDLVVCDEAHKMAATVFGGETKYTKRYKLGQLLSGLTRHFLLMSATPHNGKEADFQLFMALLDGDRFEGRYRDGVHVVDVSDLMRRMVKESLLKFDGTPLFPERIAYTVPYELSEAEAHLYKAVTDYVRDEFDRAAALENDKRAGTVGFALTVLQRRLASSPEAIFQSLRRRCERLESRLRELEVLQRGGQPATVLAPGVRTLDAEDVEDLEDAPDNEVEAVEEEILDQATAARTIGELKIEIGTLKQLEAYALSVCQSGTDTKWKELAGLLGEIFTTPAIGGQPSESAVLHATGDIPAPKPSPRQKLVIFTEHRDTAGYLGRKIGTMLGDGAVVTIHGGMGREERMKAQETFKHDPEVKVLLATDAAGEGINLQRAHLMVNYDLPWNPNRLEQRFGLFRMRQFFETYRADEKVAALLRQLPWTHHMAILGRCKHPEEREFYLRLAVRERWSSRELQRQLAGALFERVVLSPPKVSAALRQLKPEAETAFRDAYMVEFLELSERPQEADLHQALLRNLSRFLAELGHDFCFVGSEVPLQVGGRDFALDLLFFHRGLLCLVAIELKIGEFEPEHLGKLNFYLEALDRDVRKPHEGPSIGMLLCASKSAEVAEYALSRSLSPALVAEYQTRLPDKKLLEAKLHEFLALSEAAAESGTEGDAN